MPGKCFNRRLPYCRQRRRVITIRLNLFALLAISLILAVPVAGASFPSTSFGFPTMFQSRNTTAFNQAIGNSWDLESLDFSPFGTGTFGFPVVSQSGVRGQSIEATEFAQTTTISAFSYPAITTGLSGFGSFDGFGWL